MEREEISRKVATFSRWHYDFDLKGVRTPIFDPRHRNRHLQRKRYFFDPLIALCGGSFSGRRVLDLGCNAGYWSLLALQAGADFVLGVDGRQAHIDQANLVFEANGVDSARYSFVTSNIFDTNFGEQRFDIVLCLGIMYHIAKPVELMELISTWNDDLVVIDTGISRIPGKALEFVSESIDEPRDAVDYTFALWPTRASVFELLEQFDYHAVMLRPAFSSWEGCREYRFGFRRAFICAKRTPLNALTGESLGPLPILRDLAAWSGLQLWRAAASRLGTAAAKNATNSCMQGS
jgi:tRNA (mo5U34)-methyltransferase